MFERYTEKARRVIFFARYEASQFRSPFIETEHLLLGILREDKGLTNRFLRSYDAVGSIRKQIEENSTIPDKLSASVDLPLSNESKRVLAYAAEEAERLSHKHIGTEHLFLGLLREEKAFAAQILEKRGVRLGRIREELARDPHHQETQVARLSVAPDGLHRYLSDLEQQTQPLIGRENELDRLIELLCHFTRKNPVLVGEPGVGKRTIVGALTRRMESGDVPSSLKEKAVVALDLPPLRVLEKDGAWHERLDQAMLEAAEDGKIFFVNRMHDRPGGISPVTSFHVTDLLQRSILAGKIQCIGTATPASFRKLKVEGHWLAEYFEPIEITPADKESAITVLHGIKGVYEKFHNVSYSGEVIAYAVDCATKYINNRSLPGSAVDVIDKAGAAAQAKQPSLPEEVVEHQKRINFIVQRIEASVANHEFEKARFYSNEERNEREELRQLHEKYKSDEDRPMVNIRPEDIDNAARKMVSDPGRST